MIPEIAEEETFGELPTIESEPQRGRWAGARATGLHAVTRVRWWRWLVLLLAAAYFLIPLYAGLRFSFENNNGQFSLEAVKALPKQTGFTSAFFLSVRLAVVTTVVALALMVPTAVYVHLRLPKLRRLMDFVTTLPIVIPPIVLILGMLRAAPLWAKASPYLLAFMYVTLAFPFVYRSLDAGLSSVDLKTLTEASRSLGGRWPSTLGRVIVPNIRTALLSATVLTLALVLGEFTMASLDLWTTLPVWIYQFQQEDAHIATAAAMLSLVGTWLLLTIIISFDRPLSRRRQSALGAP